MPAKLPHSKRMNGRTVYNIVQIATKQRITIFKSEFTPFPIISCNYTKIITITRLAVLCTSSTSAYYMDPRFPFLELSHSYFCRCHQSAHVRQRTEISAALHPTNLFVSKWVRAHCRARVVLMPITSLYQNRVKAHFIIAITMMILYWDSCRIIYKWCSTSFINDRMRICASEARAKESQSLDTDRWYITRSSSKGHKVKCVVHILAHARSHTAETGSKQHFAAQMHTIWSSVGQANISNISPSGTAFCLNWRFQWRVVSVAAAGFVGIGDAFLEQ